MTEASGLQFERADYEQPPEGTVCAQCSQAITKSYYLADGRTLCGICRNDLERVLNSGTPAGRFVRAAGAGLVAAFFGFLLYYGIARLTGYEFGLIAIVVGFAVGSAVRWGSNGRGGWVYQALAIFLTYLAIVSTYIPPMITALQEMNATEAASDDIGALSVDAAAVPAAERSDVPSGPPSGVAFAVAVAILLGLAFAAPFLAGVENIIGLIIIAIGLFEAWKLNKRTTLTITGPHALARPPAPQSAGA